MYLALSWENPSQLREVFDTCWCWQEGLGIAKLWLIKIESLEVHASIFCRSVFRASFVDKCLDTSSVMAVSVVKMLFGFQIQVTWLIFSFPISNQVTLQNEGWPDSMRGHMLLRRELVQCFKPNSGNCFQISRDSKARPWQHSAQADWYH